MRANYPCYVFATLNCRSTGFILEGFPSSEEELRCVAERGMGWDRRHKCVQMCSVIFIYDHKGFVESQHSE